MDAVSKPRGAVECQLQRKEKVSERRHEVHYKNNSNSISILKYHPQLKAAILSIKLMYSSGK